MVALTSSIVAPLRLSAEGVRRRAARRPRCVAIARARPRSMNDLELPAPSSALGKLQRGRGAGWIEAVERSDGRELLVTCLAADPRWDSQVEDRASYYAELCIALAVPAIHIDPQGLKDDDARWLRFDVLAKWPDATTRRRSQFCRTTYVPALTPTLVWHLSHASRRDADRGRRRSRRGQPHPPRRRRVAARRALDRKSAGTGASCGTATM